MDRGWQGVGFSTTNENSIKDGGAEGFVLGRDSRSVVKRYTDAYHKWTGFQKLFRLMLLYQIARWRGGKLKVVKLIECFCSHPSLAKKKLSNITTNEPGKELLYKSEGKCIYGSAEMKEPTTIRGLEHPDANSFYSCSNEELQKESWSISKCFGKTESLYRLRRKNHSWQLITCI